MSFTLLLLLLCIALLIEGFFSGSEMALISVDRFALRKLSMDGNTGAKLALKLISKPEHVLATTLVGTNLCVAFQATLTTIYVFHNYGQAYDMYGVLILSPIVLIVGEVIPKTIFQRYAESLAPKIALPISIARIVFSPITWLLGRYTDWLSKKLNPIQEAITGKHQSSHRDELRYLLTYGQKEVNLKASERRMIRRILDFRKAEVKNALIPLVNVDAIEDTLSIAEALDAFTQYGHSRLPIYHERIDNIVGIIHSFDLFSAFDPKASIATVMKTPHYAPESQQLERLLFTMQKHGIPMSVVVDEYGGAVGILTIEDILEEIVGDIKDEYDHDAALFREISEGAYLVQGRMEISAMNETLKFAIPKGDYETLAGFLLQQFNKIPEVGDELYYNDIQFTVRRASSKMIEQVEVKHLK